MSLIQCPECSQNISDKAESCPKCGFPVKDIIPKTVNCLDCNTGFDLYAEVCPQCGLFNSQKYKYIVPAEPEVERLFETTSVETLQKEKSSKVSVIFKFIGILFAIGLISQLFNSNISTSKRESNLSGSDIARSSASSYENDLEERCKDWIYYRNRAYKLGKEGDLRGSEEARLAMQTFYNDLLKIYPETVISETIIKIEASGYKAGF